MKLNVETGRVEALENLLNEAREEADGLRRKLDDYARILMSTRLIMGHELKKPTTAISGYLDLVLDGDEELDAGTRECLVRAQGECSLLSELNLFFLELLKIDSQPEVLHGRQFNLERFVGGVLSDLRADLEALDRVRIAVADDIAEVNVNISALKIILSNVIENALIYSPSGSTVGVDIVKIQDKRSIDDRKILKIQITDEGPGIPRDSLQRIFSPFVRLREDVDGSGLGLTLVRSLIELYGGNVSITSANGNGTTVHLALPESPLDSRSSQP